jgi:hypothetical protein
MSVVLYRQHSVLQYIFSHSQQAHDIQFHVYYKLQGNLPWQWGQTWGGGRTRKSQGAGKLILKKISGKLMRKILKLGVG